MFLVNSCLGLFTATTCVAPLLPKLRGHFAEFLNNGSPARLAIFLPSTCVGLRYGHPRTYLATFLASVNSSASLLFFNPHHRPASVRCTSLPNSLTICPRLSITAARLSFCVTASVIASCGCAGISACCPSPTAFALSLGPD